MSAEDHDKQLAYVSHLSHISSFALGITVLDIEKDEKNIFDLSGSVLAAHCGWQKAPQTCGRQYCSIIQNIW